jgi:L-lysine exporter family protein LysE/ArgO
MRWFGAVFLAWYGLQRFLAARKGGEALMPAADKPTPLSKVLLTCVVLTWANPHVYLDTMVLIGSISTHYVPFEGAFAVGAAAASLSFFALLGFGARLLAPLFATPRAWVTKNLGILFSLTGQLIPVEVSHVDHNSLAVAAFNRTCPSPKTRHP